MPHIVIPILLFVVMVVFAWLAGQHYRTNTNRGDWYMTGFIISMGVTVFAWLTLIFTEGGPAFY